MLSLFCWSGNREDHRHHCRDTSHRIGTIGRNRYLGGPIGWSNSPDTSGPEKSEPRLLSADITAQSIVKNRISLFPNRYSRIDITYSGKQHLPRRWGSSPVRIVVIIVGYIKWLKPNESIPPKCGKGEVKPVASKYTWTSAKRWKGEKGRKINK